MRSPLSEIVARARRSRLDVDIADVEATPTAALLTLENQRLQAELRACRARASEAAEAMRRRIERNLHDGTQQRLVSLAISLGLLEAKLPAEPEAAKPLASEAREALARALEELRELSQGIYPTVLAECGLRAALEDLCERAAVPVTLEVSRADSPPGTAAAAYFAVSEALTNVVKHAHATTVCVAVSCEEQGLLLEVRDDGIGGAVAARGSGLQGLADRIEALGGELTVSSPLGQGTTLRGQIPRQPR